ncbi:MAG: condensation domain-containing protein, partial [Solirubrobacteraceae bacterium]
ALSRAWADIGGGDSRLLAMEGHGRESEAGAADVAQTVGWFTSLWPFLLAVDGDWPKRIRAIKDALRNVPTRGVGYGVLRYLTRHLDPAANVTAADSVAPRVSFNYLGEFAEPEGALFRAVTDVFTGEPAASHLKSPFALDIVGEVVGGRLRVTFQFHRAVFDATGRSGLADRFRQALLACVAHAVEARPRRSVSDFTGGVRDLAELDRLLEAAAERGEEIEDMLPLTPMQEGMVAHALSAPASPAYSDQVVLRLAGLLDEHRFEAAWRALGTQYPNLRSEFHTGETENPVAIIRRESALGFSFVEVTGGSDAGQESTTELRRAERERGFDLTRGPLLRVLLVRLGPATHEAILGFHHSILDGWSSGLLWQTLETNYRALAAGTSLPSIAGSFRDYVRWSHRHSGGRDLAAWRSILAGCPPGAVVPPGLPRLGAPLIRTRSFSWELGAERTRRLLDAARDFGITENSLFQALWGVFLGKLIQRNDVVFGATVSGRDERIPHVESIVGLLINTVPVRVTWQPDTPFPVLAAQVHQQAATSFDRVGASLGDIQTAVLESGPLIQHTVVFENYPADDESAAAPRPWATETVAVHDPMHFEFGVLVVPRREGWVCRVVADEVRYPDAYLRELQHAWEEVLDGCLGQPAAPINSWTLAHDPKRAWRIAVAATFTAEPLADPLSFWA